MITYVGLDFEASGSNPWGGSVPIQIGMTIGGGQDFVSLIGGWKFNGTEQNSPGFFDWSEEAFGVHGLTKEVIALAPPVWVVDIQAASWLIGNVGFSNRMFTIPVGYNVAGYDRQFVTRWMPNLNRLLSYRSADLNVVHFLESLDELGFKGRKDAAKKLSVEALGSDKAHDALWDAQSALEIWFAARERRE